MAVMVELRASAAIVGSFLEEQAYLAAMVAKIAGHKHLIHIRHCKGWLLKALLLASFKESLELHSLMKVKFQCRRVRYSTAFAADLEKVEKTCRWLAHYSMID